MVAVFFEKGVYRAMDDMCPHMGASLATGFLEDGVVACPWHAWRFDTRDGAWCDNRRIKIDVFDVRVEGNEIQVCKKPRDSEEDATDGKETCDARPCDMTTGCDGQSEDKGTDE